MNQRPIRKEMDKGNAQSDIASCTGCGQEWTCDPELVIVCINTIRVSLEDL
ncbi:hypothetical protein DPMN_159243 [Dreissena polymorpha]|uniref:Uncharacterized protein n=1 Tax=Dreissena polymorpha TaxID=45954 RepID=A0A9D4IMQ2_DREPO|nr:hypothetical protein DPMN_159243 [Dreissena polymorpha]